MPPLLLAQAVRGVSCGANPLQCLRLQRSHPLARHQKVLLQAAVFTNSAEARSRPTPSLRSPHQWSHIVRLIRKSPMASPPNTTKDVKASLVQVRTHMGGHSHSHGHHHHQHDNTYLTSTNRSDPGVRITRIGLYVNLGMAIAKGAGGIVFNSQA